MMLRRRKMFILCATLFFLISLALLYWYVEFYGLKIVKRTDYGVEVVDEPMLKGSVYYLKRNRHLLLVLIDTINDKFEGYELDLNSNEIGISDIEKFKPLHRFKIAIIRKHIWDGLKPVNLLAANIRADEKQIKLFVTDKEIREYDRDNRKYQIAEKLLIYRKKVILKKK